MSIDDLSWNAERIHSLAKHETYTELEHFHGMRAAGKHAGLQTLYTVFPKGLPVFADHVELPAPTHQNLAQELMHLPEIRMFDLMFRFARQGWIAARAAY